MNVDQALSLLYGDGPPLDERPPTKLHPAQEPGVTWPPRGRLVCHEELLQDEPTRMADEDLTLAERRYREQLERGELGRPVTRGPQIRRMHMAVAHPRGVSSRDAATDEKWLGLIRQWAEEHGRTPTSEDWQELARTRPGTPTVNMYISRYGGRWNLVMVAAGLAPNKRGRAGRKDGWTADEDSLLWDGTVAEVAYVLERTPAAVANRRNAIRNGR